MCYSNEVFIDPFTDFGFKRIFGREESKPLLLSFLNDLLKFERKIISLEFHNIEHLGAKANDRRAIFDLYCKDEAGNHFIIELQKVEQMYFQDRAFYYSTFPIQEQAEKGGWSFEIKPIYFIGILDFEVDAFNDDNYLHHGKVIDLETKNVMFDKLSFIYIEVPKFKKKLYELDSHLEKWLYFFKESNNLRNIPKLFENDVIQKAFNISEFLNMTVEQQYDYHMQLKYYRDLKNSLSTAHVKGELEGKMEGKLEGKLESQIEIARNLLDILDVKTIAQKTGLSVQKINEIANNRKDY
jgi:predicted transposase/invertase (TIGR01784 family)